MILLSAYFIFILDYRNVRQKANSSDLFEFKIGCKAAETTCNISNTFGPGASNERTVEWWFKKFCKGDESLQDEEGSDWPSEVDNDYLRAIIEADPLSTIQEVAEELNISHSMVIQHLKQIRKVKKLDKWVPQELTTNKKKIVVLKCCLLLLYATTMNYLLIGL